MRQDGGATRAHPAEDQCLPGLLAQLVTSKYVDSLPLYRQEAMFERYGVRLPRATQAAWMIGLNLSAAAAA